MCGIASIFAYHYAALEVDPSELRRIRDWMSSRGPDGEGEWYSEDGRVGLGHRRLAVIDLSRGGAQPMRSQDGTLALSFNGEIYNYRELRSELEKKGRIFKSQSDTEVLLHLYQEKGEAMLHDLRGMFAFILWDSKKKAMLLARDPYGIKPLYYADDGWTLRAASQVKALLQSEKVSRIPEPAGLVGFFLMGSVPEPYTLYQEIREVPAGSFMWVNELGPSSPKKYFSIAEVFAPSPQPSPPLGGEGKVGGDVIHNALLDSIRHHFVSDVPVGIFLSAGIDSGSLVGLAREAGIQRLKTITLAFEEFKGTQSDESLLAEEVARVYGTDHHTRVLTRAEFQEDLPKIFEAMDQPTIDGINTYFVAKAARELNLKVALSGLGGDELFGGYPSFQEIPRMVRLVGIPSRIPFFGDAFRHLFSITPSLRSPKFPGLLKYGGTYAGAYFLKRGLFMPWELESVLDKEIVREGLSRLRLMELIQETIRPDPKTSFGRVAALESSLYMRNQLLRDADWAGMAHSIEIRTPFVDATLLKSLVSLLIHQHGSSSAGLNLRYENKHFLSDSLKSPLPKKVIERAKTGFSVPMEHWLEEGNVDTPWARRWAHVVMERQIGMAPVLEKV